MEQQYNDKQIDERVLAYNELQNIIENFTQENESQIDQPESIDANVQKGEVRWICEKFEFENECDPKYHFKHNHDVFYSSATPSQPNDVSKDVSRTMIPSEEALLSQSIDKLSSKLEKADKIQADDSESNESMHRWFDGEIYVDFDTAAEMLEYRDDVMNFIGYGDEDYLTDDEDLSFDECNSKYEHPSFDYSHDFFTTEEEDAKFHKREAISHCDFVYLDYSDYDDYVLEDENGVVIDPMFNESVWGFGTLKEDEAQKQVNSEKEKIDNDDLVITDEIIEIVKKTESKLKEDDTTICDSTHKTLLAFAEKSSVVKKILIKDPEWMMKTWLNFSDRFAIVSAFDKERCEQVIQSMRHIDDVDEEIIENEKNLDDDSFEGKKAFMHYEGSVLSAGVMSLATLSTLAFATGLGFIPAAVISAVIGVGSYSIFKKLLSPSKKEKALHESQKRKKLNKQAKFLRKDEITGILDDAIKKSSWLSANGSVSYETEDALFLLNTKNNKLVKVVFNMHGNLIYSKASKEERKMLNQIGFFDG